MCMQSSIAAAAAVAAGNGGDDAKGNESALINVESTDSRPLTSAERNFPSTTDDSRKTPTSSARSEASVKPFGSE